MRKKRIGIPRALLYYRYGILWKNFFRILGCHVIISPETNKDILNLGTNNTDNNFCLPYRIYIGHVLYLIEKCDYILTTRKCNFGKRVITCHRIDNMYDNLKDIVPKEKMLFLNINTNKYQYEFIELFKLGLKITKNPIKIIYAYIKAKIKQSKYNQNKYNENKNKISLQNKKVLIVSQYYNIENNSISRYIINYLTKNDIITLLSTNIESKTAIQFSEYSQQTLKFKNMAEILGAIHYYKHQIDGIIFISNYQCDIDLYVKEKVMLQNQGIPIIDITISEIIELTKIETKLECLIDIIKEQNESNNLWQ